MAQFQISVRNLSKTYRVPVREAGLWPSIKSLGRRTYRNVEAVQNISFSIEAGECVGFLGPNGAGKTTTLKMLAGLLHPTSGEVQIAGYVPWKRQSEYLHRISMVLGNKSQLLDLPPRDTFNVLGEIYRIPHKELENTLDELVELLDMHALLTKPARTLSLGERMKCELIAALLHKPDILFLDEPTLGLDISTQERLRRFVAEYSRRRGATVILTSHYMADVEALCSRIIMINHGTLNYDGGLRELSQRLAPYKLLRLVVAENSDDVMSLLPVNVKVVEHDTSSWTLNVHQKDVPEVAAYLLNTFTITDLSIEEPPIEAVIDQVYQEGIV